MNRRRFNRVLAAAGFSTLALRNLAFAGAKRPAFSLVDTPEKREAYLKRLLTEICVGPAPIHDPIAFHRAISVFQRELASVCPGASLDPFTFTAWRLKQKSEFYVGEKAVEVYASHGSLSTPPEGVKGTLKKLDDPKIAYGLADVSGKIQVFIPLSVFQGALPMPTYSYGKENPSPPILTAGKTDAALLEAAVAAGTPVRANSQTEFVENQPSWNAVGSLPGKSRDEILFLAHADTVYATPGANDNMASVIAMVMLAHAFSGETLRHTLTFVATSGEEYGKLGALHYAEKRKSEGTFKDIKTCVNFDSLTWGINLHVTSKDENLKAIIREIHDGPDIKGEPKFIDGLVYGDNKPFAEAGIPSMGLNSRGYDEVLEVYHRPEDTPETVHADCVENSFRVFCEFVRRLDARLI